MTMPTTTAERRAAVGTTGTTIEMTAAATGTTGTTIVTTETGAATMTGAMTSTHRQLHRAPSGAVRFMPLRTRIIATVAGLAALSLAGAGAAALVVERERIESRVERLLSQEMAEFRGLASGLDPETGSAFASAERLIDVSMQRNVPDEHETHLGFLAGAIVVPADGGAHIVGAHHGLQQGQHTPQVAGFDLAAVLQLLRVEALGAVVVPRGREQRAGAVHHAHGLGGHLGHAA